ncbi:DUF4476 domain-containing protein [Niastella vici]|nr:DUF4476 domain-containing protein [Niastella vici]
MTKTCIPILLMLLAFTLPVRAGFNDGILSITNLSRQNVLIEIDGREFPYCNNALVLRDFTPGYHQVKVYTEKIFPRKRITLFEKNVYVRPKYYVDLIINRFGRVLIDEQEITDNRFDEDGRENNRDEHHSEKPGPSTIIPRPITDNTFASFIETIRKENFDDSRMAIARSGIDQYFFTSAQAKQLISLLSFENSKLELAKYLYGRTTDPKNYFIVYSVFTFSKTKLELAEYIKNYR